MTGRAPGLPVLAFGALSLLLPPGAGADTVVNVTWCAESIQELCDTLRDPRASVDEGRGRIREALFSPDPKVRELAIRLLAELSNLNQRDLRPYAEVLEEFCRTAPTCFWTAERADDAELHFGAREARVELLEQAIRTGRAKLPRGTSVLRWLAASLAAWQGLGELQPLTEEYLATLKAPYKKMFYLEGTSAVFELTDGAEDEKEALSFAAARLAALTDDEFARRMDEDEDFRKAVLDLGFRACGIDILSGQPPQACGVLMSVVRRQKARFPKTPFQYPSDVVVPHDEPLPAWLERLHGSGNAWRGELPEATPPEAPRRRPRTARIDPCTVPEIPDDGRWMQAGSMGKYYLVVSDLPGGDADGVSIPDGIRGHKPGETIRLKLDIRDRSGGRPTFPIVIRVVLSGEGSLSVAGQRQSCQALNVFWNRAASDGTSLVASEEIDYTIGDEASLAGLLPDAEIPGRMVPLWKATAHLNVRFGEFKDGGTIVTSEGGSAYDVRPEGAEGGPAPRPFDSLFSRPEGALRAEFFGPDLGPHQETMGNPIREYIAMVDRDRKEDVRPVLCFSQRDDGTRVTDKEPVILRRLGATPVFVGALVELPAGYPAGETVPGRAIRRPAVFVPVGMGAVGCEEPPSPEAGSSP